MDVAIPEPCLRKTRSILFLAVYPLTPPHGKSFPGLDEFTATLDHQSIPAVWITSRSRLHFDEPRRKLGHTHPFIAEDGCAVYLPEDYFHLRPESLASNLQKDSTVRLGRFTCIPMAEALPAAAEALEALSEQTAVPGVTLRSLSPRELVQNTNLPHRDAELSRQRDFDEVFFFAGVSDQDVERFLSEGRRQKLQLRQHGVLWSLAIGASLQRCIRELSRLYDRALRYHAHPVGIAAPDEALNLFPFCERTLLLAESSSESDSGGQAETPRARRLVLRTPDIWDRVLAALAAWN